MFEEETSEMYQYVNLRPSNQTCPHRRLSTFLFVFVYDFM
jgi:hypothetical protein